MNLALSQSQYDPKIKENVKNNQTRFGHGSDTGSAISTNADMGLENLEPRIRVQIWVLLMKMDLDPGPPGPVAIPIGHQFISSRSYSKFFDLCHFLFQNFQPSRSIRITHCHRSNEPL